MGPHNKFIPLTTTGVDYILTNFIYISDKGILKLDDINVSS
jgi:hypothetical protein